MRHVTLSLALGFAGCGAESSVPVPPTEQHAGASLYDLHVALVDAHARPSGLDVARGHPAIVSMFYTSCPAACPMLIANVKRLEAALAPERRADLRVVLVSLDPARDTPEALAALAAEQDLGSEWTLLTGDDDAVRKVSAVLGFRYARRADGDFDHSSMLVLLDRDGVEVARADSGGGTDGLLAALETTTRP